MDLESLKTSAYTAGQDVANAQEGAPGMLQELKSNLYGIFAKDNPIIKAREQSLSDYLSTPSRARADLLPTNLPMIEGRNLALSPTQQNAIVNSRSSAALAPLVGWNEILRGMTGSIGDLVKNAGDIYNAKITSMNTRSSNALDLYKTAIEEEKARTAAAGAGGIDLAAILAALGGDLGVGTPSLDDIFGSGGFGEDSGNGGLDLSSFGGLDFMGGKTPKITGGGAPISFGGNMNLGGLSSQPTASNSNFGDYLKSIGIGAAKGLPFGIGNTVGLYGNMYGF